MRTVTLANWRRASRLHSSLFFWLWASAALACSTVALGLPDRPIVAYSFDYAATGDGFVFVNPANGARRSIMDGPAAKWPVRYGSVTFNQMGPGMPAAGMNTKGLIVTLMWNEDAVFGTEGTVVLNELEFIQRLLDTSGSVDEALASLPGLRIEGLVPIHFFLADSNGAVAAITPASTGFIIHQDETMPVPALTNTTYGDLIARLADFAGHGGKRTVSSEPGTGDRGSLERFVIAANASLHGDPMTMADAFGVLANVANDETRWQIVFDPKRLEIGFRIAGRKRAHRLGLNEIDFRCRDRPLSAALQGLTGEGTAAMLVPADPAEVSKVSAAVLASLRGAGFGPDAAAGLTMGLLASLKCED
ncbi:hypothetical protein [Hoeflea prorocentri]|uniref:Choloylglycine hydrolase/NAAA C-terminal domain-containing protein n=1 Tax=Hoeflea prorocentri TaxID=1922333 RepID=A0A9X3ULS1_9HYPH|nr:hypothetical protein [Hoeflea prorocentri]MCY6383093.1 hypothetical protein [Hoeflea prorocentri]MDA5400893.1 hypothetical protein [Hoeflea prorocentri]